MQHTRQIDATETSKFFEKLDKTNEALNRFLEMVLRDEPNQVATYYVVSDETGDLLLIGTILKKGVSPYMEISFFKISQKSPTITHEWLKTAIEEKILPESIKNDADYIRAIPDTHELEVYRQLQKSYDSDSEHNSIQKVEIIPDDPDSPLPCRVIMRIHKRKEKE